MILNVNVGVVGHVDSGKTTLSRALSTVASTAAFDKNPQSQKRGITLDLGFSSFKVDKNIPPHLAPLDAIQITLVDCPGHASLIRTIICGAHIIDVMLLVVDINKGFQTQTSECLIIGELTCDALVVVLNKIDLIPLTIREEKINKMKSRVTKTLESKKFKNAPIVAVSAIQGEEPMASEGMQELVKVLVSNIPDPRQKRRELASLPFLFAVDHCFAISGQGTVLTGTVLRGRVHAGETVELPQQRLKKKIKSMQMFRNPVNEVGPGDRVGICVTQLDSRVMERGFLAEPGSLSAGRACLLTGVERIPYFKGDLHSKQRFHVSIGQDTVLARITCLNPIGKIGESAVEEFEYIEGLNCGGESSEPTSMLLEFDVPVVVPMKSLVIGSRFDTDPLLPTCRLAFHGIIDRAYASSEEFRTSLCVYRYKQRRGEVERVLDPRHCIVRGLFKRETNWDALTGLAVTVTCSFTSNNESKALSIPAIVEGSFGQCRKCRIQLFDDLPEALVKRFNVKGGKKSTNGRTLDTSAATSTIDGPLLVTMNFKKHVFDPTKRFVQ